MTRQHLTRWTFLGLAALAGWYAATTDGIAWRSVVATQYEPTKVLLEKESQYHYIRVTQNGTIRRLQFRRSGEDFEESAIDTADRLQFPLQYYRLMMAGIVHQPAPKSVLFVGMGAGTLSMALHHYYPEASIDNVELDPEVVAVARQFFGLREDDRMKVYVRDGRVQVRRFLSEQKKYDLIFLDAFRGGYIPYHLTTKEFLDQIVQLLSPNGIVVSNLRPGFKSYAYQRRTYDAIFHNHAVYGDEGNLILVCDNRTKPLSQEQLLAAAAQLQKQKQIKLDLVEVIRQGASGGEYSRKGPILTDDYAPTEVLRGMPLQ